MTTNPQAAEVQDNQPVVQLSDVSFSWPGAQGFSIAIDDLQLQAGSRTLLLGPSGGGKSTLLSLLCGIAVPRSGCIEVLGTDLTKLGNGARDRFRAEHIGVIFQMFNLLPYGSPVDNVVLPLSFATERRARASAEDDARAEAERILGALDVSGDLLSGAASELSVGQQQRVAAARALIGAPELIVADEPTSALDTEREAKFLDLLFAQVEEAGSTLIMVSHDEALGPRFDQVMQLSDIVSVGAK